MGGGGGNSTQTPPNLGGLTNMLNSPGMNSLVQQMLSNPQLMNSMMSAPYTQNMFQSLASNPDMARQIIGANPLFANNPQLQDQLQVMMPTFLQQLQNPEVQNLVSNPQALQAVAQIQSGIEQLRETAPGLLNTMGLSMPPTTNSQSSTTTSSSTTTTNTTSNSTTTTSPPLGLGGGIAPGSDAFANLMSIMVRLFYLC